MNWVLLAVSALLPALIVCMTRGFILKQLGRDVSPKNEKNRVCAQVVRYLIYTIVANALSFAVVKMFSRQTLPEHFSSVGFAAGYFVIGMAIALVMLLAEGKKQ